MTILEAEKELFKSIAKSTDLYYHVFLLITEIQRKAFLKIDAARNRLLASEEDLNPNTRFVDNPVIARVAGSRRFQNRVKDHLVSLADCQEVVTLLYNRLVESEFYTRYMQQETVSFEDHRRLVLAMISDLIAPDEEFYEAMEEKSIFWNDDLELVASIAYKTVRNLPPAGDDDDTRLFIPIYDEDDMEFAKNLFRKSLLDHEESVRLVDPFINNWDIDRVSDVEKIILTMALTELRHFPFIPVKVSFDEYIEITKCYCSPKSSAFINGVLDKVLSVLREQEEVQKSGRGLME
jgi:N utilization substance protein B